jgi:hypothetical protein
MKVYSYYDISGDILYKTVNWLDEELASKYSYFEGDSQLGKHYYSNGELREKRDWEVQINGKEASNLPPRCTVYCGGSSYEVTDGSITLDIPEEMTMDVTVRSPNYLEKRFKL